MRKDRITYVDKSTTRVLCAVGCSCRGETRVRKAGQAEARQARVIESRYVIKVMSVKWKGGTEPEVREDQRMYRSF